MVTTKSQNRLLNEVESREMLEQYDIKQNQFNLAENKESAMEKAKCIGFPVVLKVVSPKIVHKSNFGGVKVGLKDLDEISNAYDEIMENAFKHNVSKDEIDGVTVQEMVSGVEELIIGVKRDPIFGTIIVIGLGGVWVELMKDVCLGIAPLSEADIHRMLKELKGYPLLDGYRGREKADLQAFVQMIQNVVKMVVAEERILELDLNPVIIKKIDDGSIAVDARIVMKA